jgi:hypothetical protein
MAINLPNMVHNRPVNLKQGRPLQVYANAFEQIGQAYQQGQASSDLLTQAIAAAPRLPEREQQFQEIVGKYKQELDAMADEGRYEQYGNRVRKLAREFANDPYLQAMAGEVPLHKDWNERIVKNLDNQNYLQQDADLIRQQAKSSLSKPIEIGEDGRVKNTFQPRDVHSYVDIGDKINNAVSKLKANISERRIPSDLPGHYTIEQLEKLSERQIYDLATDLVTSDPEIRDYLSWKGDLVATSYKRDSQGNLLPLTLFDLGYTSLDAEQSEQYKSLPEDMPPQQKIAIKNQIQNQLNGLVDENGQIDQRAARLMYRNNAINDEVSSHVNTALNFANEKRRYKRYQIPQRNGNNGSGSGTNIDYNKLYSHYSDLINSLNQGTSATINQKTFKDLYGTTSNIDVSNAISKPYTLDTSNPKYQKIKTALIEMDLGEGDLYQLYEYQNVHSDLKKYTRSYKAAKANYEKVLKQYEADKANNSSVKDGGATSVGKLNAARKAMNEEREKLQNTVDLNNKMELYLPNYDTIDSYIEKNKKNDNALTFQDFKDVAQDYESANYFIRGLGTVNEVVVTENNNVNMVGGSPYIDVAGRYDKNNGYTKKQIAAYNDRAKKLAETEKDDPNYVYSINGDEDEVIEQLLEAGVIRELINVNKEGEKETTYEVLYKQDFPVSQDAAHYYDRSKGPGYKPQNTNLRLAEAVSINPQVNSMKRDVNRFMDYFSDQINLENEDGTPVLFPEEQKQMMAYAAEYEMASAMFESTDPAIKAQGGMKIQKLLAELKEEYSEDIK